MRLLILLYSLLSVLLTVACEKDYYATLGLPRDCDEKAIKKAYKALSLK
jgi:hypothetical protein